MMHYQTTQISDDTNAILLLSSPLGHRTEQSAQSLTASEYADVANALRLLNARPHALLRGDDDFFTKLVSELSDRVRKKVTTDRLKALMGRGGLLALALSRWTSAGIWIASRADSAYPSRYKRRLGRAAPPLVFGVGPIDLLERGGLAVVGSRKPDPESESYSREVGRWAASQGIQVVSGAARGVDELSMLACALDGGTTVGVVAESLLKMSVRREFREPILAGRATLISSFDPEAGFNVGNAMARNRWIYALSDRALVVACSENRGGTWAGATEALERGYSVFVKTGNPLRPGNEALLQFGALPAPSDLGEMANPRRPETTSRPPLLALVEPFLLDLLREAKTSKTLSQELDLVEAQASAWLDSLVSAGKAKRLATGYIASNETTPDVADRPAPTSATGSVELALTRQEYLDRAQPALIQLNRHLVGVFRRGNNGRIATVGTGFLVELAGQHYIATAGHNLDEDPFGVTIWWFQPGSLAESLEGSELKAACGPEPRISTLVQGLDTDLGLILLRNPKRLLDAGKSFYRIDHLKEKQPASEDALYFLLGFPARYAETIPIRRTPGGVHLPDSATMQQMQSIPIPLFEGLSQARDGWFEMKAECRDPDPQKDHTLDYGGYSGGPVFRMVSAQGLNGDPAGFELFGLEFSQRAFRHHALLKFHYIHQWRSFAESQQTNAR